MTASVRSAASIKNRASRATLCATFSRFASDARESFSTRMKTSFLQITVSPLPSSEILMDTFWTHPREVTLSGAAKLLIIGAPGGIRTPNPQIRSLVLCPIELRAQSKFACGQIEFFDSVNKNGGERGI
jgi:hypothetical protein